MAYTGAARAPSCVRSGPPRVTVGIRRASGPRDDLCSDTTGGWAISSTEVPEEVHHTRELINSIMDATGPDNAPPP